MPGACSSAPSSVAMFVWLLVVMVPSLSVSATDNMGTTVHIREIFIGRCFDYSQIRYKTILPKISEDCKTLYNKFFEAFSMRPPCAVSMDNYQPFMEAAKQQLPQDKAMFWSGNKDLAHEYASDGERYVTLEDTMIGYVVDGMVWCGQSNPPGMNYSRCPSWTDCPSESSEAFWAAASRSFARAARGHVTAIMDASREDRPAYRRDSFFGKYELPNLSTSTVTGIKVLLTHPLDSPGFENCENGSMILLKEDVAARGFSFSCVDDPDAILHLLCVENPFDRACRLASKYMFRNTKLAQENKPPLHMNSKPRNRF